jgi:hypothetical protein
MTKGFLSPPLYRNYIKSGENDSGVWRFGGSAPEEGAKRHGKKTL